MASESKKPEEDSSILKISDMSIKPPEGIVKEELYKVPLGANIDFTIKSHLTDATFIIEGKKIYAGSDFLSILSPFFNALLKGGFAESKKDEIELKDVTYDEFHEMLRCLSDPFRQIDALHVESLLILGDLYDIKCLIDRAEDFLISTEEFSVSSKLLLADRYRLIKLQMNCIYSFTDDEEDQVRSTEEYAQLSNSAKETLDYMYSEGEVELSEVEKVEEPLDGFVAVGRMAVEDRDGVENKSAIIDLAGLIWELHVYSSGGFKVPFLTINRNRAWSIDWSVEGFAEATMTVLDLENGKELRSMKKTFALKCNSQQQNGTLCKLLKEMNLHHPEFASAREFLDLTIYITRASGLRSSPNFDFTVPSELTDVAFIVEGRKVHVNRQYLSVISPLSFEIFNDSDEVEVKNVEYKDFVQFLQWIYPSQRRYLTASWMFSTLKIARQLEVDIDTSVIERYFELENDNVLYLERMTFYFEFNMWDKNKLKEGVWYGLRGVNRRMPPTKLYGAFVLIEKCPLYSKMSHEKKVDLYRWMGTEEYDL